MTKKREKKLVLIQLILVLKEIAYYGKYLTEIIEIIPSLNPMFLQVKIICSLKIAFQDIPRLQSSFHHLNLSSVNQRG